MKRIDRRTNCHGLYSLCAFLVLGVQGAPRPCSSCMPAPLVRALRDPRLPRLLMPPSRTSIRRPLADRISNAAACTWFAGLVAWYAGASAAIDRTLDGMSLFLPVAVVSLIGGVAALCLERKLDKGALGTAVVLATGLALLGFDLAALFNRYADDSAAYVEHATVRSFQDPAKGPPTISVGLGGKRLSFEAAHAEGCRVGSRAAMELRQGAFGARWLQSMRCEPVQRRVPAMGEEHESGHDEDPVRSGRRGKRPD